MRSPHNFERRVDDFKPRRPIFGHFGARYPNECLNTVAHTCRDLSFGVWKLALTSGRTFWFTKWLNFNQGKMIGYTRFCHEENDQQHDYQAIERSNPICPPPAKICKVNSITGKSKLETYLVRATRKPNAKDDKNGDPMKPIVHMFN